MILDRFTPLGALGSWLLALGSWLLALGSCLGKHTQSQNDCSINVIKYVSRPTQLGPQDGRERLGAWGLGLWCPCSIFTVPL